MLTGCMANECNICNMANIDEINCISTDRWIHYNQAQT